MSKRPNKTLTRLLTVVGLLLVVLPLTAVVLFTLGQSYAEKTAVAVASELMERMPPIQIGVADSLADPRMPVAELDGTDYVGVVTLPAYGRSLPIADAWSRFGVWRTPCRFGGSVYGDTLVIGGSDNKGQFDFMEQISCGDTVSVTGMDGYLFSYAVAEIHLTEEVSAESLTGAKADLVLFARDSYSLDYTVVLCTRK